MHPSADGVELLIRAERPTNAYEETVQRLLQSIRLGMIGPGERLPAERDLAVMLKVSRDTVREALATLAEAGLVLSRRGRYGGTFVVDALPDESALRPARAELGEAEVEDTTVLRRVLEVGAAREAAARDLSADERAALARALEECRASDDANHRRLDSRLHLLIAELSGSPSLVPLVADLRTRVNALLDEIPMLRPNLSHSDAQHEAVVSAILAGRPQSAAEAMLEHIEGSAALLRGFLSTR
ncbi:GntR family transcriptional regulator [Leucobacter sp. OLJS4]|uniref:FadR/GntR family transcriptional regulator n=1 Tax=unclassified Leucobacter TaxID=2621730 RepID=UPI000C1994DB|nr:MULTISPECIES: FCD domain-containing protein [unclassified Leucobacter]PII83688.1 GntR family transcriptional regulator [Leucobacter sp. OLCALW19]PII87045.1 GntR family transcriptional regulator [Leucobacter sp. OLTLW20]PII89487.1 GntR family transcriptional regulator [Leucobacter sp. OLAS13]PII97940.1 GntR family transcriptional regulator [Leucobacter sp. OLDS2]PIJ01470.1 GntR family transcriptional regulator [Leucobacter sp. OLIS6]